MQSLRSIQNQNMKELEIIIVNDFSSDNTSRIIENLGKEDSRIKIINNKKKMGTLYTRCIGTLYAKGKYILPLDGDDMILNFNVIDEVFKASKNIFDIVYFKTIVVKNISNFFENKNLFEHRNNKKIMIVKQPKLGKLGFRSAVLWGQIIIIKNI